MSSEVVSLSLPSTYLPDKQRLPTRSWADSEHAHKAQLPHLLAGRQETQEMLWANWRKCKRHAKSKINSWWYLSCRIRNSPLPLIRSSLSPELVGRLVGQPTDRPTDTTPRHFFLVNSSSRMIAMARICHRIRVLIFSAAALMERACAVAAGKAEVHSSTAQRKLVVII